MAPPPVTYSKHKPGKVWLHDRWGTAAWYDLSGWVSKFPSRQEAAAEGGTDQLALELRDINPKTGAPLPVDIVGGQELIYYLTDWDDPGDYTLWEYQPSGKVEGLEVVPVPDGVGLRVSLASMERELNTHVPFTEFLAPVDRYDKDRLQALFEERDLTDGNPWDAHTYIAGPFVDYNGQPAQTFYRTNLWNILKWYAQEPLADSSYTFRRWYVTLGWENPAAPGTGTAVRQLHWYEAANGPQHPYALTDSRTGLVNLLRDTWDGAGSFAQHNANTGQQWTQHAGTWEFSGGQAYLGAAAPGGLEYAASMDAKRSDVTIAEVQMVVRDGHNRLIARVKDEPATAYKWSGLSLQPSLTGTEYEVAAFVGGGWSLLATIPSVTPNNGDTMQFELAGTSVTARIIRGGTTVGSTSLSSSVNLLETRYGISQEAFHAGARFDNFRVVGKGERIYKWRRLLDYSGLTNMVAIQGPGSSPFELEWDNTTRLEGRDGTVRKTVAPTWEPSTAYAAGDYVVPRSNPNGGEYRAQNSGTSGASEPSPWATVEGGTTGDNGITWVRDTWGQGGGASTVTFTDDGGYIETRIAEEVRAVDNFTLPDGPLGRTESGHDWESFGTTAASILAEQLRFTAAGEVVVDAESGTSAIVEATLPVAVDGARLVFRAVDANSLWYVQREGSGTGLYKRVGGIDSFVHGTGTMLNNGDTVKVSLRESVIDLYINGAFQITVTDSQFAGATKHGLGATSAAITAGARFDAFKVWTSYSTKRIGFASSQANVPPDYGILIKSDKTAVAYEGGVEVGSTVDASLGVGFRVQARMETVVGVNGPLMVIRYLRAPAGSDRFIEFHQHVYGVTINEDNPVWAVVGILTPGAAANNLQARRFTYAVYSHPASVSAYGRWWAKEMLEDEELDTNARRQAAADSIFARYAFPRDTLEAEVKGSFEWGSRVPVTIARLGWVDVLRIVAQVQSNKRDKTVLILGDSPYEYGEDEPLGPILRAPDRDTTAPPEPTAFAAVPGSGVRDGVWTVSHDFTWAQPSGDEWLLHVEVSRVREGGTVYKQAMDARAGKGTFHFLAPATAYKARARYVDRRGNKSPYTAYVNFSTMALPRPATPAWASPWDVKWGQEPEGRGYWLKIDWLAAPLPDVPTLDGIHEGSGIDHYLVEWKPTNVDNWRSLQVPSTVTEAIVPALQFRVPYEYRISAVDSYGVPSRPTQTQTKTVSSPLPVSRNANVAFDSMSPVYEGSGEVPGWRWVQQPSGATLEVSQGRTYRGNYSLKITVPPTGGGPGLVALEIEQDPEPVVRGSYYEGWFGFWVEDGSAAVVQDLAVGYNDAGVAQGTLVLRNLGTPALDQWHTYYTGGLLPSSLSSQVNSIRRRFLAQVDTTQTTVIYMVPPMWEEARDTTALHANVEANPLYLYANNGTRVLAQSYNPTLDESVLSTVTGDTLATDLRLRANGRVIIDSGGGVHVNVGSLKNADPGSPENGDVWLTSSGGVRTLKVRDGSTTVTLVDTSTSGGIGSGTSFPGSPTTGLRFFRTDRGREYYYDGTRWLGIAPVYVDLATPDSSTTFGGTTYWTEQSAPEGKQWWLERGNWWVDVATTNNGLNFWTLRIGTLNSGLGGSVWQDQNTATIPASTVRHISSTTVGGSNPSDFTNTNNVVIFAEVRKDNGTPGNLRVFGATATLREVG